MSRKRITDIDTATAEGVVQEERAFDIAASSQNEERDRLMAQTHQMIGQIKAADMFGKFANVSSLVWLQQVKESKIYRDVHGVGTWENFCNLIGLSRQKVDMDLQNLAAFGEEFLLTVSSLSVGYRDLRKLRQIANDGGFHITETAIEIAGEVIPLDRDHKEDLQAAVERLLDQKDKALEEARADLRIREREISSQRDLIKRQEAHLTKLEKEATAKGLSAEEEAFLQRLETLATSFDGYLLQFKSLVDVPQIPGLRAASTLLAFLNKARMELNAYYATAYDRHAPADMAPEEEWEPGKGAAITCAGEA